VFWCNHCPYVKAWEDRLIALKRQYAGRGVEFDETQAVARQFGATRTPEVFLFDRDRTLRYHGAPDDNFEDPAAVTHHHLRDAIEALLAGREPAAATTAPRGCTIKWRK
jgi:thioredoxin-like negative regulator of GroEL